MRNGFAIAMSAVLTTSGIIPVMAAEEETFTPTTYQGIFSMTGEGESLAFAITVEQPEEDYFSISAEVTLPASVADGEEEATYGLNDVLRIISGDAYINVSEICGLFEEFTGMSVSYMLPFIGIEGDWIEIPALEVSTAKNDTAKTENQEAFLNELMGITEFINVDIDEAGNMVMYADEEDIYGMAACVEGAFDTMIQQYADNSEVDPQAIFDIFSDYILAAAEGINAVTPEISIEEAQATIEEMLTELFTEDYQIELLYEEEETLTAQLRELIDSGMQIALVVTLGEEFNACMDISMDEENVTIDMALNDSGFYWMAYDQNDELLASLDAVVTEVEDGFEAEITCNGEETSVAYAEYKDVEGGFRISVTFEEDEQSVNMAAEFTATEGVSIDAKEAISANLMRDVVKNVTILIYSSNIQEEAATAE